MGRWNKQTKSAAIALLALAALAAQAQVFNLAAQDHSILKTDPVQYLFPEQVSVAAGKPVAVALHFRIKQGLHINSHTPTYEELIPTVFSIPDGQGVRLDAATYPAGIALTLPFDPTTKLSAYTGDFVIQARVVAAAGNHLVQAKLRYQACTDNTCYPPKTVNVPIDVIAK